ncbi:phage portal protein family protein, partial [Neisseria meningitidis]
MAKKNNKTKIQKPEAALQTDVAQITATGRVIAEHPSNFITPQKMRALFEDAESGDIRAQHELFADIEERDSDIAANMGTRKRALLTLNWRVAPPRNATPEEEKLSDQAYEMMDSLPTLEDLIMDLMDAVGHGFSALEVEWVFSDGLYLPRNFIHRPQSWFKWDKDNGLLLRTRENPEGEALWPLGWVVHTQKSRSVQQARNGLFRTLSWLYMFKHYAVHDFAEFLELYGMPIRIGKYGAGATKEEKNTLLRAVAEIGHNAAGIMPEGMEIELHNAANGTTATSNPFLQMADWCEKSAARLILGQTLTSGADGKSSTNALG